MKLQIRQNLRTASLNLQKVQLTIPQKVFYESITGSTSFKRTQSGS